MWTPGAVTAMVKDIFSVEEPDRLIVFTAEVPFATRHYHRCTIANLRLLISIPPPLRRAELGPFLRARATGHEMMRQFDAHGHLARSMHLLTEKIPYLIPQAEMVDAVLEHVDLYPSDWANTIPWIPIPKEVICYRNQRDLTSVITDKEAITSFVEENTLIRFTHTAHVPAELLSHR